MPFKDAEQKRAALRAHYKRHPNWRLFHSAKERVKARDMDVEFSIRKEDIVIPSHCPCCGVALIGGTHQDHFDAPTLDRIDNKEGYTTKNIWVICWRCNAIKRDASPAELRRIADAVERVLLCR